MEKAERGKRRCRENRRIHAVAVKAVNCIYITEYMAHKHVMRPGRVVRENCALILEGMRIAGRDGVNVVSSIVMINSQSLGRIIIRRCRDFYLGVIYVFTRYLGLHFA